MDETSNISLIEKRKNIVAALLKSFDIPWTVINAIDENHIEAISNGKQIIFDLSE